MDNGNINGEEKKGLSFPVFKTKIPGDTQKFSLEDPAERRRYFDHKAGAEIEKLREYLRTGTFVGFLLGKKNSGKGTYSKLFMEAVGKERVAHLSVGDIVRGVLHTGQITRVFIRTSITVLGTSMNAKKSGSSR